MRERMADSRHTEYTGGMLEPASVVLVWAGFSIMGLLALIVFLSRD